VNFQEVFQGECPPSGTQETTVLRAPLEFHSFLFYGMFFFFFFFFQEESPFPGRRRCHMDKLFFRLFLRDKIIPVDELFPVFHFAFF